MLLPLQIAGLFGGPRAWSSPVTWAVWLPMLVFEVTLAVWLIAKGVGHARCRRTRVAQGAESLIPSKDNGMNGDLHVRSAPARWGARLRSCCWMMASECGSRNGRRAARRRASR